MTTRAPWSQADDALLRARVLEGATNQAIGDELSRTGWAVRWRRSTLGLLTGISRSEGRARALRIAELAAKGWSDRDIAKALGETHAGIQKARQRADVQSAPQRIKWTSLRVEVVAALMGDGVRPTGVDRSLGLRAGATQRQLNRLGIGTDLAAGDIRDALLLVNMRARGMSDPEICEAFGWYGVPQRFQKVGRRPGARADVTWTADEDEELRRLTAAGQSLREIAAAAGRSDTAVAMRRVTLGTGKPGSPRWTPSDDAQLVDLFQAGGDDESIGRSLSRSAQAVGMRRLPLGLRRWRRWGSEEDAILVVKAAAGASNIAIATELGRSSVTVQQRREALGLGRRNRGAPWTPQGDALLVRLRESGRSWREISEELGRTRGAAAMRADALGLGRRYRGARGAPWTPQEDALLLRLRASGRSWREIGRELGRTRGAAAMRADAIKG